MEVERKCEATSRARPRVEATKEVERKCEGSRPGTRWAPSRGRSDEGRGEEVRAENANDDQRRVEAT